ncbi:hypothetical protein SODALDRAFT_335614 [Sodiomyces alkalinus F11]|uniref:RRM domain-containing protein n=1 Tax=Sodiomyces alkalinus (strain CBS 110278 / VKM F-3762 / F11) TaxID=1314773 RepID=A0A3N2PPT1_SODAK|nr:hypothetical protein SODALDRAFT_335614 [Sodiomyces alkalinus F11]ROT36517.1 hypothetical protein SODALDRAFT_335614 [Sodiomyces alkalinus F11]
MAPSLPVGEDRWVDYVAEHSRGATDLEKRVQVIELYKLAVDAEPNSLKVWRAYCEYFWSLHVDSLSADVGWPEEEQIMGRDIFSLNAALSLWQQGYEAIQYRISDSHELWDRWISLERGLLDRTRTSEGVRRITHLYTDRLQTPHVTHEDTAQAFSSFLSTYNQAAWESTMQAVTAQSQEAKQLTSDRDMFELRLGKTARDGKDDEYRSTLREYLEWEACQSKRSKRHVEATGELCRGLYARALTGVFAFDEAVWTECIRFLATSGTFAQAPHAMLDVIRRAVDHCPWSGALWSRYILSAEEAKLPFHDIEQIKHKATSHPDLYKNGMTGLLDMYAGWCGFLKRTAMDINASDEAVDIADMGLRAAIEFVDQAKHRYGDGYRGDPAFRLERIYIQYLTDKKGCLDDARHQWHKLAEKQLYADSYDFWMHYYMWEMMVFASNGKDRSPTPSTVAVGLRVPSVATAVLGRAIKRKTLDWPEKVMEVYVQHCNDYELPSTLRSAMDSVAELQKEVGKRRELEAAQAAEQYAAAQAQQQQAALAATAAAADSSSGAKRKWEDDAEDQATSTTAANKRQRGSNEETSPDLQQRQRLKRDRENTSVLVSKVPSGVTQTKIRQYFKEYGHINSLIAAPDKQGDTQTILIEFRSPDEAQSALLRDGKYLGDAQISVAPGTDLTIYATNYPPTAGPDYLRKLFEDCGEMLSIRMPSLKGNVRRRFSYITFRDREASTKATKKDGMMLDGRYKLTAAFSDPSRAKKREGAVEEGREVRVTNLDPSATEDDAKEVFSKYGTVHRVTIPRNKAGRNHGTAYVELGTKEEATKAAEELDKTKYRGSILTVEISAPKHSKPTATLSDAPRDSPARSLSAQESREEAAGDDGDAAAASRHQPNAPSQEEIKARSIALLDIPDTVNDARIRDIVQRLGGFKSLVLRPSHGSAKIEFEDAASAGRAALQLDGYDLDGRRLRTGGVEDLKFAREEFRTDKIVYGVGARKQGDKKTTSATQRNATTLAPPPSVRRPVLGRGGGGGGPRRGLGFLPKKNPDAPLGAKANGTGSEEGKPAKKTNAEFRTMFLKGNAAPAGQQSKDDAEDAQR